MAEKTTDVANLLEQEKLREAKSSLQTDEFLRLTNLATKSKLFTFWAGILFPGGGFFYLQQIENGTLSLFVAILLIVLSVAFESFLLLMLFLLSLLISTIIAISNVDNIRNDARIKLLKGQEVGNILKL